MGLINETKLYKFLASKFVAMRTIVDGRESEPNFTEIANAFNPLGMPLSQWTRIIENPVYTEEYPNGIYFINNSFIQFYFKLNSSDPYDMEIVENNILLLSDGSALALNTSPVEYAFGFNYTYLELN